MNINDARKLKVGDRVLCPADRGVPAHEGRVTHVNPAAPASKALAGSEYIWVEVQGPDHKSVWPSNRLGKG